MYVSIHRLFSFGVALCALTGALLFFSTSALAAAPEVPETLPASEVSNTTALLEGIVNPHSTATVGWYFLYKQGAGGCTGGSATALQPEAEVEHWPVTAALAGLQPGAQYSFCVVARNAGGETTGSPLTFTTSSLAPSIDDEYAAEVGLTSGSLNARINPHGSAATYHFEYGTTSAYGLSTPSRATSSTPNDFLATARLMGLSPDTTYDARVVTENEFGSVTGTMFTFRTFPSSSATVPDGRVYEMVSPVHNDDADIYAPNSLFTAFGVLGENIGSTVPFQVAENGETVTYAGDPVIGGNGSGGASIRPGNQFVAKRSAEGWTQEVIAATGASHSYYEAFSPQLTVGILHAGNGYGETTALLPEAAALSGGYHVLYERNIGDRSERALFTHFEQPEPPGPYEFTPRFVGGSSSFSTEVFDANAALIPGAPVGSNVYASVAGQLSLVNVLPGGAVEPQAQAGGVEEQGGSGEGSPEFSHAVSADGSRIFWTGLGAHPNLYMREGGTSTVQLDASQAGGPGGGGHFWTASADGARVFFTDDAEARLTSDTVPASGVNLYEYDVAVGRLTDLTPASQAGVQGVIGASADGAYVYFVANGVLASGASTGACTVESGSHAGLCNLYVRHAGANRFIRQLSDADGMGSPLVSGYGTGAGSELHGDWREGLGHRTAQVAASGTLVFDSELSLTDYRNDGAEEVYAYDPAAAAGAGELICASCDPSGQPPAAPSQIGGILPASNNPAEVLRGVSADGHRVFFDSNVALLPQDTNGRLDVYSWERQGSGDCAHAGNCVSLLSGGTSLGDSYLMGASASGDDVLMVTRAQLVEADRNENYDVYDARVGGTRQSSPPSCSGTGCQGVPPAPASFATPSSVTFEGVGNFAPTKAVGPRRKVLTKAQLKARALQACRKQPKRKRAACVRRVHKRYGPTSKTSRSAKGGK